MVILLSTRGTAGSDIWFMCLADEPMVRSYHPGDYGWTPLSQNPAQTCDDSFSASASGGNSTRGSTAFGARGGKATATRLLSGRRSVLSGKAVKNPSHAKWRRQIIRRRPRFQSRCRNLFEQPPHCEQLKLSLATVRFVRVYRTDNILASRWRSSSV